MRKIREIDITSDGLYFVVKVENNLWAFVDSEDREVVLGESPEDVIAKFYSSISSDDVKREDIKINVLDSNKAIVCVKDDCWECNAEFE
jgi:uncharacterized protein YuzB (UPF0349 family)